MSQSTSTSADTPESTDAQTTPFGRAAISESSGTNGEGDPDDSPHSSRGKTA